MKHPIHHNVHRHHRVSCSLKRIAAAILVLIPGLGSGLMAKAAALNHVELLKTRPPRDIFWAFDASMIQTNITAPDDSKLQGLAGSFTIGYGRIRGNSWLAGRFHFLAGPWDASRGGAFDSDYYGSAIDVEYGTSFPGTSLRSLGTPLLSIAAGYMDLNGRNIGANRKNNGDPNDTRNYYLEQDFKTGFGAIVVSPGCGLAWTSPPRPSGNEPELLVTRIESAYVRFAAMIPLYSRARVEVIKRSPSDSLSQSPSQHTTYGPVKGYSLILSTGVWLGV